MKSLIILIAILFTFSCCSVSCGKGDETTPPQNNGSGNNNPTATKMKITIGTAVFTATLYDNFDNWPSKHFVLLSILQHP